MSTEDLNVVRVVAEEIGRGLPSPPLYCLWLKYEDDTWIFVNQSGKMFTTGRWNPDTAPESNEKIVYRRSIHKIRRVACSLGGFCWKLDDEDHYPTWREAMRAATGGLH